MPRANTPLHEAHLDSLATLAGGVAHEFNNVLTVVLGYGSLIPDLALEPERLRQVAGDIMSAARRGADVVYQLQLFARTHDSPHTLHDFHQVVADSVNHTTRNWPVSIQVRRLLDSVPASLPLNAAQVILAVQHLLQNAREALLLDIGCITVRTSLHSELEPPALCLSVEDDGIGMPPAVRERACEPFFTRHSSIRVRGLGLSVVHGIVHAHGGRLEMDAPAAGGTRVRLWFPYADPMSPPSPSPAADSGATHAVA